ncbi:hypothetical protein GE061_003393 [Apolygus lucorum]|uniref:Secreted protein n=1 Tax=Apolygus lucorum TaxID=248454 RepID=A0A8S9X3S5_APOLU|nr:hypothetical protein GE061_003393 [Apolygus lucorum]
MWRDHLPLNFILNCGLLFASQNRCIDLAPNTNCGTLELSRLRLIRVVQPYHKADGDVVSHCKPRVIVSGVQRSQIPWASIYLRIL